MNDLVLSAFVVFIIAIVASRLLGERSLKELDTSQKGQLIEAFSRHRTVGLLIITALILVFLGFTQLLPGRAFEGFAFYALSLFAYIAIMTKLALTKLRALGLPQAYMRLHVAAVGVKLMGLGLFIGLLAIDMAR